MRCELLLDNSDEEFEDNIEENEGEDCQFNDEDDRFNQVIFNDLIEQNIFRQNEQIVVHRVTQPLGIFVVRDGIKTTLINQEVLCKYY